MGEINEDMIVEFEERAAHLEFGCGYTRLEAECQAAEERGYRRWRFIDAIHGTGTEEQRDISQAA